MHRPQVRLLRMACAPFVAALLFGAGRAAAADPDDETRPLLEAVRAAVADGRVTPSNVVGFTPGKPSFAESPSQPGFLRGFDLGVGPNGNSETIWALRAVFWTSGGDEELADHGQFHDRTVGPKKKTIKTRVTQVVHIRAKAGYAVGGVSLRTGLTVDGFSATFMRIKDGTLNPHDTYESDWVGDPIGAGGATHIIGDGAPVVGFAGNQDDEKICALGLAFMVRPAPVIAPPAVVPPIAAPPVDMPPRPRPQGPRAPPAEDAENPRAPVPADPPPADPQPPPPEAAHESAAAPAISATAPASAEKPPLNLLLTYGVPAAAFVAVAGLLAVVALSSVHRKRQIQARPANRPVPAARPPVAAHLPASTAFRASPAPLAVPLSPAVEGDVIELTAEDFVPDPVPSAAPAETPKAAPASGDDWPRLEL